IKKELRKKRRAVEEELPNLSLQLTLLLNAGLVVTAAFDEILRSNKDRSRPLYEILRDIHSRCDQTNESFVKALHRFAQTTGSRDFLRLSTLISDHAARGSELAEKLERERASLWEGRLQKARASAKEVETKLCLPMMLLLCVLVVIAIAPALMEM
ncbi:MAG: type II secretion system F family protein, partial [Eubacteriales bacterium]|nr:type II secretion system F family protein [Eubacteriales bacterium]